MTIIVAVCNMHSILFTFRSSNIVRLIVAITVPFGMMHSRYYSLSSVVETHNFLWRSNKRTIFSNLCKLPCRWRWLKKKGMAMILFWSFAVLLVTDTIIYSFVSETPNKDSYRISLLLFSITAIFPLAGWIADVYIGRYRVIKACMIVLCIGSFSFSLGLALKSFLLKRIYHAGVVITSILVGIGLSGFQANIVQFSMDQLSDSSSSEVISFIIFYVWAYFAADVLVGLGTYCICEENRVYTNLLIPLVLSLAVASDFLFNHLLIKEPVTHNPVKLIFKVLQYAVKNKYPRQRSAFTYWDDKRYSRLDLGKSKFGGPFTTEQVEDVKTFFKLLGVTVVASLFGGLAVNSGRLVYIIISDYPTSCTRKTRYLQVCVREFVANIGSSVFFIGLPLWEFAIFPLFHKYLQKCKILKRMILGMLFQFMYLTCLMAIELFGHFKQGMSPNQTLVCPISMDSQSNDENYSWFAVPSILYTLGGTVMVMAMIEFISAQSPYSMKGLMFGMAYLSTGFSAILFSMLFGLKFKFAIFFNGLGGFGCLFWYLLAFVVLSVLLFLVFLVVCYGYKSRQRDDNLPSQHYFAEEFYDRLISNNSIGTGHLS